MKKYIYVIRNKESGYSFNGHRVDPGWSESKTKIYLNEGSARSVIEHMASRLTFMIETYRERCQSGGGEYMVQAIKQLYSFLRESEIVQMELTPKHITQATGLVKRDEWSDATVFYDKKGGGQ